MFSYFHSLIDCIQDVFVISFRKKRNVLYFQLENILRLFEVMKMIFKKCIRIVNGTSNLTSRMYTIFLLDSYTDIFIRLLYRYSYKMYSI